MSRSSSKGKNALSTILFVGAVIGMLVGFNLIAARFFKRLDLTSDRVYTLSEISKNLVRTLPDRLNVKLFISEDLPPDSKTQAQFAQDLLNEYETYSQGKFHIELVKMKSDDLEKEKLAKDCKVQKLNRGERSKNKLEIASTYLGICFDYHGQIESIPAVERAEGLEFEISGLIKRLTVKKRKLAFITGEGELGTGQGLQIFSEQLRKSGYEIITIELKATIPEDVDGLLIVGPKQKFSDRAKYVLDQFLMKGKSVALFVDGEILSVPKGGMMPNVDLPEFAQLNDTGLDDIIQSYGIKINHDIVLDQQNAIGPVPYEGQAMGENHPVFVLSRPLGKDSSITHGIELAIFPFASSLELTKNGNPTVQFLELARSSKESWNPPGLFVFDRMLSRKPVPTDAKKGPFAIAYAGSGKFKSFFVGKSMIKEDGSTIGVGQAADIEPMLVESKESARLLVIGNSQFISDPYIALFKQGLKYYIANLILAVNIADWMVQDEGLAVVRNKGMQSRPLKEVSETEMNFIKVGNIIGVPLIVCLIGILKWRIRLAKRKRLKFTI